ncbi:response regulator [Desulfobacterales bacterium HSG17]|nr:response regulator [Desulfobacterales bacterium HSG17]
MMQGEIQVESKSGKGSNFIFSAVFARPDIKEPDIKEPNGKDIDEKSSIKPEIQNLNILIIDDSAGSREMLNDTLQYFSSKVTSVDSGEAALEILKNKAVKNKAVKKADKENPFLVLMDWNMPGMNGMETAKKIRTHHDPSGIQIILMLTAYGKEEIIQQAEDSGIDGILVKPVIISDLIDTISEVMAGNREFGAKKNYTGKWKIDILEGRQGARILLAEDNYINQQLATELLEQAGLRVSVVNNGCEVLDKLAPHKKNQENQENQEKFDLVLMDILMPEMDGYETTKAVRKIPEFEMLPIIAMTANAMAGDREKYLGVGMNDHIPKPIDPGNFFSTLKKWIPEKESRQIFRFKQVQQKIDTKILNLEKINFQDHLSGINISEGLKRVGGNRELYINLLINFFNVHSNDADLIIKALYDNDLFTAQRLVHNLKAIGGSIGALKLFNLSEILNNALKENAFHEINEPAAALNKELGKVMSSIASFAEITETRTLEHTDQGISLPCFEELASITNSLKVLMDEMDPESEDRAGELYQLLGQTRHKKLARKLVLQIEDLEFEAAGNTLEELITELK